jgi:hypothetical protein
MWLFFEVITKKGAFFSSLRNKVKVLPKICARQEQKISENRKSWLKFGKSFREHEKKLIIFAKNIGKWKELVDYR